MTDITFESTGEAPRSRRHPLLAVVEAAEATWNAIRKARARRRGARRLMEMDTRELQDIGISRSEIYARVYGQYDPSRKQRSARG